MNDEQRYIPAEIRREVRRRCGFGCIICGMPVYEYHHIIDWAIVKEHTKENITLLCPNHHANVTAKLISQQQVEQFNRNPKNIGAGKSGVLPIYYEGAECTVTMGTNFFTSRLNNDIDFLCPLMVDGVPLIKFTLQDGHILLDLLICDSSNTKLLEVQENALIYYLPVWDAHFTANTLTIRDKEKKYGLSVTFKPPSIVKINSGLIFFNGIKIDISKHKFVLTGDNNTIVDFGGNKTFGLHFGIQVGPKSEKFTESGLIHIVDLPRFYYDPNNEI